METQKNLFKLEKFEIKTGIMLNINNKYFREGEVDPALYFNDTETAKKYVDSHLQPGIMFVLSDCNGNIVYENIYDKVLVQENKKRKSLIGKIFRKIFNNFQ